MLSDYQLKITEIINGNAKKLVLNSSVKEKVRVSLQKLANLSKTKLKLKKVRLVLESDHSKLLKSYITFTKKKRNRIRKKWPRR